MFCWQSDLHPTSSYIRKVYGVIGISDLVLMIKLDSYLYFLAIHFPVSLACQPGLTPEAVRSGE